jgi:hypothetical protein
MNKQDFTTTLLVDESPQKVFEAIGNVRGWWTGRIEGATAREGDEFTYQYEDLHRSRQRVTQVIPGQRVVWQVLEANLSFAQDKDEWVGTEVRFEIARKGERTELRFTHAGLVPSFDCFEACSSGWSFYIGESLRRLITGEARS